MKARHFSSISIAFLDILLSFLYSRKKLIEEIKINATIEAIQSMKAISFYKIATLSDSIKVLKLKLDSDSNTLNKLIINSMMSSFECAKKMEKSTMLVLMAKEISVHSPMAIFNKDSLDSSTKRISEFIDSI